MASCVDRQRNYGGYSWYEEQSLGLGMEFLRCVEATLLSIQRNPLSYPTVHVSYRRSLVRRFPFAIFFEFVPNQNRCVRHLEYFEGNEDSDNRHNPLQEM